MEDETVYEAVVSATKLVVLACHQPSALTRSEPIQPELVRAPLRSIPVWSRAGQKNLSDCYEGLRALMLEEGLGFLDPEKWGGKWMTDLCKLLYHLSPYHTNFKSRGFKVDDVWKFSAGLKSKIAGRKDEPLTVDFMKATIEALNTLNLATCLVTEPFANSDLWCT